MSSDEDSLSSRREKFKTERRITNEGDESNEVSVSSHSETLHDNTQDDLAFGPALPPHLLSKQLDADKDKKIYCEAEPEDVYGPKIPSSLKEKKVIGPEIPTHLIPTFPNSEENSDDDDDDGKKEDDDDDNADVSFGPDLSLMSDGTTPVTSYEFSKSKHRKSPENITKRESWMLELPPEKAATFGMGPRQFRTKLPSEKDSDRSGWTETPSTKGEGKRKSEESKDELRIREKRIKERDKEMEKLVRKAEKKKKRDESLLEIHRKKMKKKAKKEAKKREKEGEKPVERRPFDRNIDLQVNRFDEAQKRAVLKKAQLLNDRFAQGESKFL